MTVHQWLFHYQECIRARKRKADKEKSVLNILEAFAIYSHPSVDLGKLQSKIQERKLNETISDVKEDLEEQANALLASIPKTVTVTEDHKEQKPVLKTMKVPAGRKKKNELN
jgi:hypothetical protein